MAKKRSIGRGRPSSIDRLPEDLRTKLNADLRERRKSQLDITAEINEELAGRGKGTLSKSSVNRYSKFIEEKGAMMREARAAAEAMLGGLEETRGRDLGRLLTEMVKTHAMNILDRDGDPDLDALNKLALIAQRIERSSKISLEREAEAERRALEKAAKKFKGAAKAAGVSGKTISALMDEMAKGGENL